MRKGCVAFVVLSSNVIDALIQKEAPVKTAG